MKYQICLKKVIELFIESKELTKLLDVSEECISNMLIIYIKVFVRKVGKKKTENLF
jgi:hypothetical protein